MKSKLTVILGLVALIGTACSKEDDGPDDRNNLETLQGQILYEYTSNVKKIDLSSGDESDYFSYNAYSTNGWTLSKDGKIRLISEREPGTIRGTQFKLINVADNTVLKEFEYMPLAGNNQNHVGELSDDHSLILIQPDFDNGIVIIDTNGEIKFHLEGINDQALTIGDRVTWLPGNSLLISFDGRFLLRADPPYTSLDLVKEMNYEQWGNARVSPDGTKLSFYIANHIHLMNVDGSGMVQVTDGGSIENMAEFSPDGRHLLVGTNYIHAPVSGNSTWNLKIIPADGKKYDMENSPEVIPVIPNNSNSLVKVGGSTYWRP